jgi:hypothetical protein
LFAAKKFGSRYSGSQTKPTRGRISLKIPARSHYKNL